MAGGWFDAGDYLKFTHSTAYNDVLLFTSARLLGRRAPTALTTEARYGLHWLDKMWDARTRTLYLQVGIGSGNRAGTFSGDHDLWRLPQADDRDHAHQDRFVSHRPVFAAAPAGQADQPQPRRAGSSPPSPWRPRQTRATTGPGPAASCARRGSSTPWRRRLTRRTRW